jgi:hypothetical protein
MGQVLRSEIFEGKESRQNRLAGSGRADGQCSSSAAR